MTRRPPPAALTAGFVLLFLTSRAAFFAFTTAGEYRLYKDYGDAARAGSMAELYQTRDVEYPHLCVELGVVAGQLADHLPGWCKHLVRLRPNKQYVPYIDEPREKRDSDDQYEAALSFLLFIADAACLVLVYVIARRVYPHEPHGVRLARLLGYGVLTAILGPILYDRQDIIVALFALLALVALMHGRPRLGYAILVVGTAYKLVPALLLPVWVLAAATARTAPNATPGKYLRAVVIEAAIGGAMLLVWPALTYWLGGGERGFLFLTFHSARGLQMEAAVGWPVLLIDPTTEITHNYGSFNMRGELADAVARPLKAAMLLSVAVGVLIALRGFWRAATSPPSLLGKGAGGLGSWKATPPPAPPRSGEGSNAAAYAALIPHVIASSLVVWLGFILTNKVGSPQYLMWVAPLAPLLPLRTWAERWWLVLFAATLGFVTAVFPAAYFEVVGPLIALEPLTYRGPTPFCVFLLAARSVTLTATTLWLAASVWRHPRLPTAPTLAEPPP